MELSPSTLKHIVCTLDYEIRPMMMDKKGEIISLFIRELTSYEILNENRVKMESLDKTWNIIVEPSRCGLASQKFNDIEFLASRVHSYVERLMSVLNIELFTRVGVREFHEIKLSDEGEFHPLRNYFDIPGADEERFAGLIHYQVSLENEKQRVIITLGQNRHGNAIFLTPDLRRYFR